MAKHKSTKARQITAGGAPKKAAPRRKESSRAIAAVAPEAAEAQKPQMPEAKAEGLKKRYLKSRPVCQVTFRLPGEAAAGARSVVVMGDFTNWAEQPLQARRQRNGDFAVTVDLPLGGQFRYRYLVDGTRWENDWWADHYEPNPFGEDDSVVIT